MCISWNQDGLIVKFKEFNIDPLLLCDIQSLFKFLLMVPILNIMIFMFALHNVIQDHILYLVILFL